MRRTYHQLTIEERCEMARLQGEGYSQRQIAASLDRSPSTVSRELRRNSSRTGGYKPTYANQQARARRWSGSKLDRDAGLRRQVLSCLMRGWSPEQVSGRLALEAGSSHTRPSTASSMPRRRARRTTPGATICPGPSPSAVGVGAGAEALPRSYDCAVRWTSGPRRPTTAPPPVIGRQT